MAIGINAIVYLIAFKIQTDKLTDLTYSVTFLVIAITLYLKLDLPDFHHLSIVLIPIIWAMRLGGYLFWRILKKGKDKRFDLMRPVWWKFGGFWLLQALSIWVISLPYVLALSNEGITHTGRATLYFGVVIFIIGLVIESVADYQKSAFKSRLGNSNKFYDQGLFSIIRFPNYLGEILVWIGIFISCLTKLETWMLFSIVSPIWVIILLTRISGIPYIVRSQEASYRAQKSYRHYVKQTKKLIPGIY